MGPLAHATLGRAGQGVYNNRLGAGRGGGGRGHARHGRPATRDGKRGEDFRLEFTRWNVAEPSERPGRVAG
jgi:hypothetical protein